MPCALNAAAARGAANVGILNVGAAFHSPLMAPVRERLRALALELPWRDARVPLVSGRGGRLLSAGADVRDALVAQIDAPIDWVACMRSLVDAGCGTFLEVGPGRVLTGLARQADLGVEAVATGSLARLSAFAERVAAADTTQRAAA